MRALSNSIWLRLLLVALVTTGAAHAAIERHAAMGEPHEAVGDGSGTLEAEAYPLAAVARGLAVIEAVALDSDRLGATSAWATVSGVRVRYARAEARRGARAVPFQHRVPLRHLVCVYRL